MVKVAVYSAAIARHNRSDMIGISVARTPVALWIALAIAAGLLPYAAVVGVVEFRHRLTASRWGAANRRSLTRSAP